MASLQSLLISTGVVAMAEMGDKTQLLALVLAARFRKPLAITLGILVATLLNHGLAGLAGTWLDGAIPKEWLRWGLAASFLGVAVWALIPDRLGEGEAAPAGRRGAFVATLVAFFLAEIGDKTQVATIALAAKFGSLLPVVAGTTLGMLIADVPAVLFGDRICARAGLRVVRWVAAGIFAALGIAAAAGVEIGLR
jgi:putative Ca2+/H+ antiporter (TMEM165/GDT1 family)